MNLRLIWTSCVLAITLLAVGPAKAGAELPPQWEEQEKVWVSWVPASLTYYQPAAETEAQLKVRAQIIAQLTKTIDVVVILPSKAREEAESQIAAAGADTSRIDYFNHEIVEYFTRDPGPLFLTDGENLSIRQFGWACFGYAYPLLEPNCDLRGDLGSYVGTSREIPVEQVRVRSEGGAIEVSDDLMIAFKDAHERRNPDLTIDQIEDELLAAYGKDKLIWLDRTPYSDYGGQKVGKFYGWGANGHTDEFVRFVSNDTVLIAQVSGDHADNILTRTERKILAANKAQLEAATGVDGNKLQVIEMPQPDLSLFAKKWPTGPWMDEVYPTLFRNHREEEFVYWVPMASYMNFFITNGQVLVPAYWTEGLPESVLEDDLRAQEILREAFPNREVVGINALPLNWLGGGIHCFTQQEPKVSPSA